MNRLLAALLSVVLVALVGFTQSSNARSATNNLNHIAGMPVNTPHMSQASNPPSKNSTESDPQSVVAYVNQEPILKNEFDRRFDMLVYVMEAQNGKVDSSHRDMIYSQIKKDTLNRLISDRLLLQAAQKHGVTVTNEEIDKIMESIKNNFPTKQSYEETESSRVN